MTDGSVGDGPAGGVPTETRSCHTAIIDGYVVEGHVPLAAIEDLLARRPGITGIALAGMPAGSPGMPGTQEAPIAVVSIGGDGIAPFGSYRSQRMWSLTFPL